MTNILALIVSFLLCNSLIAQVHSEKFVYELRFGFIKGGEAVYHITDTLVNNNAVIYATLHGYTTGFAKTLYAVDDYFESFISKDQYLPTKAMKKLKEQKFRFDEEVTFYQDEEVAISNKSGWHEVRVGICDVSSLMVHLRFSGKLDNLFLNQIIDIPFWDTDEWYILKLKFTGMEIINSHLGKIECIRLEPQDIAGRFFKKRNPMNIWVTNDSKKIPVLMELNFTIGSVKCELKNPTHP